MSNKLICIDCCINEATLLVRFFSTFDNRYYDGLENHLCEECSLKIHGKNTEGKLGHATYFEFTKIK